METLLEKYEFLMPDEAQKEYDKLVAAAKLTNLQKSKEIYTEAHHIIPLAMGGTNDKNNIVRFTGRQHFEAHWLLTKIYSTEHHYHQAAIYALHRMSFGIHKENYHVMAEEYESVRKVCKENLLGENNPSKRPEVRAKIIEKLTGVKHSEERSAIMSNARKGKKHSESLKAAMKEASKRPEVHEKRSLATKR